MHVHLGILRLDDLPLAVPIEPGVGPDEMRYPSILGADGVLSLVHGHVAEKTHVNIVVIGKENGL